MRLSKFLEGSDFMLRTVISPGTEQTLSECQPRETSVYILCVKLNLSGKMGERLNLLMSEEFKAQWPSRLDQPTSDPFRHLERMRC